MTTKSYEEGKNGQNTSSLKDEICTPSMFFDSWWYGTCSLADMVEHGVDISCKFSWIGRWSRDSSLWKYDAPMECGTLRKLSKSKDSAEPSNTDEEALSGAQLALTMDLSQNIQFFQSTDTSSSCKSNILNFTPGEKRVPDIKVWYY